jgi:beta-xylosidase
MQESPNIPKVVEDAVASTTAQYMMEYEIKSQQGVVRLAHFSNILLERLLKEQLRYNDTLHSANISDIQTLALDYKNCFKSHAQYDQMAHLSQLHFPEFALYAILTTLVDFFEAQPYEFPYETDEFYGRFAENILLDLKTSLAFDQKSS